MVVCICNAYREAEIREAARSGLKCPQEIYKKLGEAPRCGRCLEHAEAVIAEVHSEAAEPANALIVAPA